MISNLEINQDWESEHLKDLVYLYEEGRLLDIEIQKLLNKKLPAIITVVSKIPNKKHEHNSLPL